MKKEFDIECPKVPNFLRVEGMKKVVPVTDFSEKELKAVGKMWTEALIEHVAHLNRCNERERESSGGGSPFLDELPFNGVRNNY